MRVRLLPSLLVVFLLSVDLRAQALKPDPSSVFLLRTDAAAGLELWQTKAGQFWIPSPGRDVISHLQWEALEQKVYEHPAVHVRAGDTVLDCGAHIGFFTRMALRAGARTVIAVEPEEGNIAAFRRNFTAELLAGSVKLVPVGLWSTTGKLQLQISENSNDSHTVLPGVHARRTETIEVITIDQLLESLALTRVDFIKMDIEGAETHALEGAQRSLRKWTPRLAISAYHVRGDPEQIISLVRRARPVYRVASTRQMATDHGVVPKVLFFY